MNPAIADDAETLFEGDALPLPASQAIGRSVLLPVEQPDAGTPGGDASSSEIRHAAGYASFADLLRARGESPEALAGDPARLLDAVAACAAEISREGALRSAAGIFLGNTIAAMRPDAAWAVVGDSLEVGNWTAWFVVGDIVEHLLDGDAEARADFLAALRRWAEADDHFADAARAPRPEALVPARNPYVRPPLPSAEFHADDGEPIRYGDRWGEDGAPDESYSVTSHPERFAGLHAVARVLIEYLEREYLVEVGRDPAFASDLVRSHGFTVSDAWRLTPSRPDSAPVTVVFTDFPGIAVHAGVLHDFVFPRCGCDACDDSVDSIAGELEDLLLGVVEGGYRETYLVDRRQWLGYGLIHPDGSGSSSGGPVSEHEFGQNQARLAEAATRLATVPDGWRAWPPRP